MKTFVLAMLLISAEIFCFEGNSREINHQVVEQLMARGDSCILNVENDGEVFLNPSKIIPQETGVFVESQSGELFRIPVLFSNENGCFTKLSTDSTVYPVIKCWNCKKPFNPNFFNKGKCPHCGEQN